MRNLPNIFAGIPAELPDELTEILWATDSLRIERIVSRGHASPTDFWYDQDDHEWVVLLAGSARLRFEEGGKAVHLEAGDWVNIPAHARHRLEWTDADRDTIWLAVFYPRGEGSSPKNRAPITAESGATQHEDSGIDR